MPFKILRNTRDKRQRLRFGEHIESTYNRVYNKKYSICNYSFSVELNPTGTQYC